MLKVAMIARSTLFTVIGGDTVQIMQTAKHLAKAGVRAEVKLTSDPINYDNYDVLHFFNIIRPADILCHIKKSGKPYVVSTILVDYSEYDKYQRKGIAGILFGFLPADNIEYMKTVTRWLLGRDRLMSPAYLWKGQRKSIQQVLDNASLLLPNSDSEYRRLVNRYHCRAPYINVPNGFDPVLFKPDPAIAKDPLLVICVGRVEGVKNQLNLIKALNGTKYRLLIIGSAAPSQLTYYRACREAAADNISFIDHLPQDALLQYYQKAKVHVLPSWFETTGLSSLEAVAMNCNIVITAKGDTKEYFGEDAFYCDPGSQVSIYDAVDQAATAKHHEALRNKVMTAYTWQQATARTMEAYSQIMRRS
jgi:glycosyltransferase involved in cell wall biosynthesis